MPLILTSEVKNRRRPVKQEETTVLFFLSFIPHSQLPAFGQREGIPFQCTIIDESVSDEHW